MLPAIRVAFTILLTAFAAWSQTPDANREVISADHALQRNAGFAFPDSPSSSRLTDSFTFTLNPAKNPLRFPEAQASSQAPRTQTQSFSLSHGYMVRRKIHKYASIATLPLAISEAVVGQKLANRTGESDSLRSAHSALAAGIGALFGVESVTGIWNMWEGRKMPHGRGKRLFHGILMLAADAGFVATAALAPDDDDDRIGNGNRASTHRNMAYASLGIATASYVYMLFAR